MDDYIELTDEERARYKFDLTRDQYIEPNPLSLNWVMGINIKHQFVGIEFRYRRAVNKIGNIDFLPNQFIDSFYINVLIFI